VSKVFSVFRFMQSKELNYTLSVIGVGSDDGGGRGASFRKVGGG